MGIKNDPNTHVYTKCKMEIFIEKTKRRPKTNKQTNKQNKRKIEKKKKDMRTIHISNRGKHREIPSWLLKQFDWIGIDWPLSCAQGPIRTDFGDRASSNLVMLIRFHEKSHFSLTATSMQ